MSAVWNDNKDLRVTSLIPWVVVTGQTNKPKIQTFTATILFPSYHRLWSNFGRRQGVPLFNALVCGESLNSGLQICPLETRNIAVSYSVQCYFDTWNRLGADRECDRQMDVQTF